MYSFLSRNYTVLTGYLWWTFIDIRRILETTPDDFRLEEMERNKCYFFTYSIVSTIFTVSLTFC